jgi:hypothetical protein
MTKESIETNTAGEDRKEQEIKDTQSGANTDGKSEVSSTPVTVPRPKRPLDYCPGCGRG